MKKTSRLNIIYDDNYPSIWVITKTEFGFIVYRKSFIFDNQLKSWSMCDVEEFLKNGETTYFESKAKAILCFTITNAEYNLFERKNKSEENSSELSGTSIDKFIERKYKVVL